MKRKQKYLMEARKRSMMKRSPAQVTKERKKSLSWYFKKVSNVGYDGENKKMYRAAPIKLGGLFSYSYDPKHKDKLPYYDTFPLVIPIQMYNNGFLGVNFHYLSPMLRGRLFDDLLEFRKKVGRGHKIDVQYPYFKQYSKVPEVNNCIKRYLFSHVKSRFIRIAEPEWEQALFLPSQSFVKASARQVWRR